MVELDKQLDPYLSLQSSCCCVDAMVRIEMSDDRYNNEGDMLLTGKLVFLSSGESGPVFSLATSMADLNNALNQLWDIRLVVSASLVRSLTYTHLFSVLFIQKG